MDLKYVRQLERERTSKVDSALGHTIVALFCATIAITGIVELVGYESVKSDSFLYFTSIAKSAIGGAGVFFNSLEAYLDSIRAADTVTRLSQLEKKLE